MLCTYFVHRFALETCAFWGWEIVWEIVSGIKPVNGLRRSSPPQDHTVYIFEWAALYQSLCAFC